MKSSAALFINSIISKLFTSLSFKMFSDKHTSFQRTLSETELQNNELINIWSIKREAMNVINKDPNMISIVDECDLEDQYTKQDALDDIWNVSEHHETKIRSSIMGIKFKQPNSAIRKCATVQLIKNWKKTFPLQDGCLSYIENGDVDVITRFGRRGPL